MSAPTLQADELGRTGLVTLLELEAVFCGEWSDADVLAAWSVRALRVRVPINDRRDVDRAFEATDIVDVLCEQYRREHHPRAHKVVAVRGEIYTVSKTGRSVRCVYRGSGS